MVERLRFPSLNMYILPQMRDWAVSHEPNNVFLDVHKKRLETISYGASFSPEFAEEIAQKPISSGNILDQLKLIHEDFGISDIRFGIRWNRVARDEVSIDLSYYDSFLEYAFNSGMNVTLNIGPIKTFRWPEQYVPGYILKKLEAEQKLPVKQAVIDSSDWLGKEALSYADRLLVELKKTYTEDQLSHIRTIQPENESFHMFGEYKWRLSPSYMHFLSSIIHKQFPYTSLMVNSSEFTNIADIESFFDQLLRTYPQFKGKLISGINYYHNAPQNPHLPIVGKIDSISFSKLLRKNYYYNHIENGRKNGFSIEVSEAMLEPWPPVMTPGNSAAEFRFVTKRAMDHLLDPEQNSVVRIWGIERLAKAAYESTLSPGQVEIIELVRAVNS